MGFGAAITSFWKNFATFKARARRSEYWFIQLFLVLTNLAAFFIDLALLDGDLERIMAMGGGWHRGLGLGVGHYRASTGCTHPTPSRHG